MKTKKKGLYLGLVRLFAQNQVKTKKKVFTQIQPIFLPTASPQIPKGGHDSILCTILTYLCIPGTQRGGAMAQRFLPKYAPEHWNVFRKHEMLQGNL